MAISFVNKGSFASGTTSAAPGIPASMNDGDFMVLVVETEGASVSVSAGWTQVTGSPLNRGTANNAGGVRLAVYTRAWVSGDVAPTVTTTGAGHNVSMIFGFRGVDTTTPLDGVTPTTTSAASSGTLTMPGITTATNNAVVVHCMALDSDNGSTNSVTGNPTNANLTFTGFGTSGELHDQTVATGRGGGIFVAAGRKAVAGATGNTTATQTASAYLGITLSLRPLPGAAAANLTLHHFTVSGTATVVGVSGFNANASLTLSSFLVTGSAQNAVRAQAARTLAPLALTASAQNAVRAQAALTFGALTLTGQASGLVSTNASASLVLSPFLLTASAQNAVRAQAALTLAPLTVTASTRNAVRAQAALTLAPLTTTASAQNAVRAQAALTLAPLTFTGQATGLVSTNASAALTLAPLQVSGSASTRIAASAALTLRPLLLSAAGAVAIRSSASVTLGRLTVAGSATVADVTAASASLSATLGVLTLTAAASVAQSDQLGGSPLRRLRRWRRRADPLPDPTAESDDPNDYRKFEPDYRAPKLEPDEQSPAPELAPIRLTKGFLAGLPSASEAAQLGIMLRLTNEAILSGERARLDRLNSALAALKIEVIARQVEKERRQQELDELLQELIAAQLEMAAQEAARAAEAKRLEDEEDDLLLLIAA